MTLALLEITDGWMQSVVREMKPDNIRVNFFNQIDADLPQKLNQATFVVSVRMKTEWVQYLTRCKLVQQIGVGYDNVDRQALHEAGIPLAITPHGTPESVAEHVFMMMLALSRNLMMAQSGMKHGEFPQFSIRRTSHFLFGKTIGIVGLGRIGKRVAQLAHAFDLSILYNDLIEAPKQITDFYNLQRVDFDTLLSQSDIVTVHVPLTDLTRGFIGNAQFRQMKPDALFINTSRGQTYDMDALAQVMKSGHLRAAGLDVWNPEPPTPNHPIFELDNVITTPHMASGGVETVRLKTQSYFDNMLRVLNGEQPLDVIPYP